MIPGVMLPEEARNINGGMDGTFPEHMVERSALLTA